MSYDWQEVDRVLENCIFAKKTTGLISAFAEVYKIHHVVLLKHSVGLKYFPFDKQKVKINVSFLRHATGTNDFVHTT